MQTDPNENDPQKLREELRRVEHDNLATHDKLATWQLLFLILAIIGVVLFFMYIHGQLSPSAGQVDTEW